jgi:type II secretory pathway component PulC
MVDALKPGEWVKAWKQVIADTSGPRLTAEAVEKVVHRFGGQSKQSKPLVRKKALPNVSKGLAKVVDMVKSALAKKAATIADYIKTLRSVLHELTALQVGPLQPRG